MTGFGSPLYPVGERVGVYEGERWPVSFSTEGKSRLTMDRAFSKWIVYVAIGLAVAYFWVHYNSLAGVLRARINDWWK